MNYIDIIISSPIAMSFLNQSSSFLLENTRYKLIFKLAYTKNIFVCIDKYSERLSRYISANIEEQ
jgi:hypothetical protein